MIYDSRLSKTCALQIFSYFSSFKGEVGIYNRKEMEQHLKIKRLSIDAGLVALVQCGYMEFFRAEVESGDDFNNGVRALFHIIHTKHKGKDNPIYSTELFVRDDGTPWNVTRTFTKLRESLRIDREKRFHHQVDIIMDFYRRDLESLGLYKPYRAGGETK
jgi:hypothetical protein